MKTHRPVHVIHCAPSVHARTECGQFRATRSVPLAKFITKGNRCAKCDKALGLAAVRVEVLP